MRYTIWRKFLSVLYPVRCPYCQAIISCERTCCENCDRKIERHLDRVNIFNETERGVKSYCFTPLKYNGSVKQAIWRYKFRGCRIYSEHFADEIIKGLSDAYYDLAFDIVTFVPMSKTRKLERGYNQSEVLAEEIAKRLRIECGCLLAKSRDNCSQHNLDALARVNNVRGAYCVRGRDMVQGKKIILCDDVFTTGNTLKECCRILYESGAGCVECVAIAHTEFK